MATYRVRAHNTSSESANKIHDDAVARTYGFRGGLVPGTDVYAYLCHLPAERWGRAWLERGTMAARFAQPVYEGDEVEIEAVAEAWDGPVGEAGGGPVDGLVLTLRDSGGEVCATGRATLLAAPAEAPDPSDWPAGDPPPAERPPATFDHLAAATLGRYTATFHARRAGAFLDDIREHLPLFRGGAVAHPGWLLRHANYQLMANVLLGPWIHVESATSHLGAVHDGETVETRARVERVYERSGHQFVDLDVLQLAASRPVARVAHRAIFRPRTAARS